MSKINQVKMVQKFINDNFSEMLKKEGFLPTKKSNTLWVKLSGEDYLSFIAFEGLYWSVGDFNISYGCLSVYDFLPIDLVLRETDGFCFNNFKAAKRFLEKIISPEKSYLCSGYRSPLSASHLYEKKLESITMQLEMLALPELREDINKDNIEQKLYLFAQSPTLNYKLMTREEFIKHYSYGLSQSVAIRIPEGYKLCQNSNMWSYIKHYYLSNAIRNNEWENFEKYLSQVKEYNIKLLKRRVPGFFDNY